MSALAKIAIAFVIIVIIIIIIIFVFDIPLDAILGTKLSAMLKTIIPQSSITPNVIAQTQPIIASASTATIVTTQPVPTNTVTIQPAPIPIPTTIVTAQTAPIPAPTTIVTTEPAPTSIVAIQPTTSNVVTTEPAIVEPPPPIVSVLVPGDKLKAGQSITSENNRFTLELEESGELAILDKERLENTEWQGLGFNKRVLAENGNDELLLNGEVVGDVKNGEVRITIDNTQMRGYINGNNMILGTTFSFDTDESGAPSFIRNEMRFANTQAPVRWSTNTANDNGASCELQVTNTQVSLLSGSQTIWRCLPLKQELGNVERVVLQDSGVLEIISDTNKLLWSSNFDIPVYLPIGVDFATGAQLRSIDQTVEMTLADSGSLLVKAAQPYSTETIDIHKVEHQGKFLYLRPDGYIIAEHGVYSGRTDIFGNYKITIGADYDITIVDLATNSALTGFPQNTAEGQEYPSEISDRTNQYWSSKPILMYNGEGNKFVLVLSPEGKLFYLMYLGDALVRRWDSKVNAPEGTTMCYLQERVVNKVFKFVVECFNSIGEGVGEFDPFVYNGSATVSRLVAQSDANLVIYDGTNKPIWASGSHLF